VQVVFRPPFTVEGIATGTPVRVQGIVVGQVSSVGLDMDMSGCLRPAVRLSLNPATLEDRGFADRLRGDRLHEEVERGLRARLVAVNRASGLLEVELVWDRAALVPSGLARDEIPPEAGAGRRAIDEFLQRLEALSGRDLVELAAEIERDLDGFYPATDPARAARFSASLVERTGAVVAATGDDVLGAKSRRLSAACARLRDAVAAADRGLDDETLALLQVRLADAGAALASFSASLEGARDRMGASSDEVSRLFRAVSEAARQWSRKAAGLTTEPAPR
jgi:ABC-type transporter Mla subunit MlaD